MPGKETRGEGVGRSKDADRDVRGGALSFPGGDAGDGSPRRSGFGVRVKIKKEKRENREREREKEMGLG